METSLESARDSRLGAAVQSLTLDERYTVMEMFAQGRTIGFIRKWFTNRAARLRDPSLAPSEQDLLYLVVKYGDDIEEYRQARARDVLSRGLARKEVRIERLANVAEVLEPQALDGINLKAADLYRKILGEIREETDPLRLRTMNPDDPWAQLLTGLNETRASDSQRQNQLSLGSTPPSGESESAPVNAKSSE
jgi:hypothetical protein